MSRGMKHPPRSKKARWTGSRLSPEGIAGVFLASTGIMVNGTKMLGYENDTESRNESATPIVVRMLLLSLLPPASIPPAFELTQGVRGEGTVGIFRLPLAAPYMYDDMVTLYK